MFVPFVMIVDEIKTLIYKKGAPKLIDENAAKYEVYSRMQEMLLGEDGVIDGSILQSLWFPTEDYHYDVFISHSHHDYTYAVQLASWLENYCDLKCFVDGFVWKSADKLLNEIDKIYTWHEERGVYDYKERNFSTSHVHAMLSMAIFDIIDRSECCVFIESEKSIELKNIKSKTLSPWLYEELTFMKKGRITVPARLQHTHYEVRNYSTSAAVEVLNEARELKVSYDVDLDQFKDMTCDDVIELEGRGTSGFDAMYMAKGIVH